MHVVVDRLGEVLTSSPDPVLSSSRVGARRPSGLADVPSVCVSLTLDPPHGAGLGRFVRPGHVPVRHSGVVEVRAGVDAFTSDLRRLRLAPLPVRSDPASTSQGVGGDDVTVANVTAPTNPRPYRFAAQPGAADEYLVDAARGEVVFGAAQTAGDRLDVRHWTMSFKEDIRADRYAGALELDVFAGDVPQVEQLARRVQGRLRDRRRLLRERGFLALDAAGLEAAESVELRPPAGSPVTSGRIRLTYRFAFEAEAGGEDSGGAPIQRIDVAIPEPQDDFSIPHSG